MEITRFINSKQREVLAKARKTYGETAQILVANEELCELAAVCAKYPRYSDKQRALESLRTKAIDEVADVLIILDHVANIFDLTPVEIGCRIAGKVDRLDGWLKSSTSMEQTTIDREVPGQRTIGRLHLPCAKNCIHRGDFNNLKPGGICLKCADTQGSCYTGAMSNDSE